MKRLPQFLAWIGVATLAALVVATPALAAYPDKPIR